MSGVKIIDKDKHWNIRRLKEAVYMLGYSELLIISKQQIIILLCKR